MRRKRSLPDAPLVGAVRVPGDKSISHRALIFAGLASGRSTVTNLNLGHDVRASAGAMGRLGANVQVDEDNARAEVESPGLQDLTEPADIVWAGNSGTTLRCLAGVCATVNGISVLTGDDSLRARPMLRVVAPLRQMGATIDGRDYGARAPLTIRGGRLAGIDLSMKVASAQVQTAILLAGLGADGSTSVTEPGPLRDHTERMLASAGVDVSRNERTVTVTGGNAPKPDTWRVPGDFSSAAFLIAGALLLKESDLTIEAVGLNPTRTGMLDALQRMGATVHVNQEEEWNGEPVGQIRSEYSPLQATEISGDEVPRLIDELPVLAVLATQAEGTTTFADAQELRVKESDRIESIAGALNSLGADIQPTPDGMVVRGPTPLRGGEVDAHNDHRVALAMAVAGFVAEDPVTVLGWSSVNTSFPEFLDVLAEARTGKRR